MSLQVSFVALQIILVHWHNVSLCYCTACRIIKVNALIYEESCFHRLSTLFIERSREKAARLQEKYHRSWSSKLFKSITRMKYFLKTCLGQWVTVIELTLTIQHKRHPPCCLSLTCFLMHNCMLISPINFICRT